MLSSTHLGILLQQRLLRVTRPSETDVALQDVDVWLGFIWKRLACRRTSDSIPAPIQGKEATSVL
jgi:hypothetical protein